MSNTVTRLQLRNAVSFAGKSFESLTLGTDGKDVKAFTCRQVAGGVYVQAIGKMLDQVLWVPDGNILSVAFIPDASDAAKQSGKALK